MQIIKRSMKATMENAGGDYGQKVQASFNSDGRLTLRTDYGLDNDTIFVLSESETKAIFNLFKQLKQSVKLDELPF